MDRQQQEALLKKTWMDRERQFYGEEIEEDFAIPEEHTEELMDSEEDDIDRDEDRMRTTQDLVDELLEQDDQEIQDEFMAQINKSNKQKQNYLEHQARQR